MKCPLKLLLTVALLSAVSAQGQVTIENFSSVQNGTNRFYGTWELNGLTLGSTSANSNFVQGAGVYNITGSAGTIPTNSDSSKLEFFYVSPSINLGTNASLAVTAQTLSGNAASSFKITLSDLGGGSASATFSFGSFPNGGYSTATATLSPGLGGFDPSSVYSMIISGDQFGGTNAFKMSFDNVTAVPEPSTYAAIFGTVALGIASLRRSRRNRHGVAAK